MNHDKKNANTEGDKDAFISAVMNSLDGIEIIDPAPFFYGRVKNKLLSANEMSVGPKWVNSFFQSQWAIATIVLLLVTNLGVVVYSYNLEDIPMGQASKMEVLIDEYQLEYTSLYSYLED